MLDVQGRGYIITGGHRYPQCTRLPFVLVKGDYTKPGAFIFSGGHRYPQCTRLRVIVVKATADYTKSPTPS